MENVILKVVFSLLTGLLNNIFVAWELFET